MNQNSFILHTSYVPYNPKYLWFLMLSFSMIVTISNWFDARLIDFFGITVTPGCILFPWGFLLSDIITEVYGYKHARRAIWVALLFNTLFIIYGKTISFLPSPSFYNNNDALDKLIDMNFWIIAGSFISFIIAEPLNAYLIAKLKIKTNGKYIGFRFIASTIIASTVDTPIFVTIAFYNSLSMDQMISMGFSIWMIKCFVEIALLPFSIRLTKVLKYKEQMNIYDINTNFNPFRLDVTYPINNNKHEE